jgi:hypothetical protein
VILRKTSHSASEEDITITAPSSIDPARFLHDRLESAAPDLLRSMLTTFINALMSTEADAVCCPAIWMSRWRRSGRGASVMSCGKCGAFGGTRTPNLLIRRSVEHVLPVRLHPYPQVRVRAVSS